MEAWAWSARRWRAALARTASAVAALSCLGLVSNVASTQLLKLERLSAAGVAEARAEGLKLEKSAHSRSRNVYAKTPPAEPISGGADQ